MLSLNYTIRPVTDLFFELGLSYLHSTNFRQAAEQFNRALLLKQESSVESTLPLWHVHWGLAEAYLGMQQDKTAIEHLLLAFPDAGEYQLQIIVKAQQVLNEILVRANFAYLQQAVNELQSLPADDPLRLEIDIFKGRVLMLSVDEQLQQDADKYFMKALATNPDHAYALENLGECYRRSGNTAKALELFNSLSDRNQSPDRQDIIELRKALSFFDQGEYTKFLELTVSLTIHDTYLKTVTHKHRAISHLMLMESEQASEEADKLLSLEGKNEDGIFIKAKSLILRHEYEQALLLLNQGLAINNENEEFIFGKSQALIEGLIDLEGGLALMARLPRNVLVRKNLQEAQYKRSNDGNHWLFKAHISFLSNNPASLDLALQNIDRAIIEGINGSNKYPQLYAYELKAKVYEKLAMQAETSYLPEAGSYRQAASEALFETGRFWYWQANYEQAESFFEKAATAFTGGNALKYWYRADNSLMRCSALDYANEQNKQLLKEAAEQWEEGMRLQLPGSSDLWSYLTMARIVETASVGEPGTIMNAYRDALYYSEQSIFLNENDYFNLTFIGRYLRLLGLPVNALDVLRRAETINKEFDLLQEEMTSVLLDLGEFDKAMTYLTALDPDEKSALFNGWRGFLHYCQGDYKEAVKYLNKRMVDFPADIWTIYMRMLSYWHTGATNECREDANWMYEKAADPRYESEKTSIAFAAFLLDNLSEATSMNLKLLENDDDKNIACCNLSYIEWRKGNLEMAEEYLIKYVNTLRNERQLKETLRDLELLTDIVKQEVPQMQDELSSVLKRWTNDINARVEFVKSNPLDMYTEIAELLASNNNYQPSTRGWKGLHATLGRLYIQDRRPVEALGTYLKLYPPAQFEIFTAENIAAKLSALKGREDYWQLKEHINQKQENVNKDKAHLLTIIDAAIDDYFNSELQLNKDEEAVPLVNRIAIELASNLIPPDTANWPFITQDFPALREELQKEYGVIIPPVRVRAGGNGFADGSYRILLDNVPFVNGYYYSDYVFCPQVEAGRISQLHLPEFESVHTADAPNVPCEGYWILRRYAALLTENAIETIESPHTFILRLLKKVIRKNLSAYAGLRDLDPLLENYFANNSNVLSWDILKDDINQKIRLTKVIKGLLAEQVPVTRLDIILTNFSLEEHQTSETSVLLSKMRMALKQYLPPNQQVLRRVHLPKAIEEVLSMYVTESGGKTFLALPPREAEELTKYFNQFYEAEGFPPIIVVQNPLIRLYAKKYFRGNDAFFIAENELLTDTMVTTIPQETKVAAVTPLSTDDSSIAQSSSLPEKKVCPACGAKKLNPQQKFCAYCGYDFFFGGRIAEATKNLGSSSSPALKPLSNNQ